MVEQVWHGKRPPMTIGEAALRYFHECVVPGQANSLATTTKSRRLRLEALVRHFGQHTRLGDITASDIADWKSAML